MLQELDPEVGMITHGPVLLIFDINLMLLLLLLLFINLILIHGLGCIKRKMPKVNYGL
jgi:hypothetical protein